MNGRERDGDDQHKIQQLCKMFVGGLSQDTDVETLKERFKKYGEITDAVVIKDADTKRSRGFGFITFDSPEAVDACLAGRPHEIDGREVEVKQAIPRGDSNPSAHIRTRKLFLGGLTLDTEAADVREALSPYGSLLDVQIMTEKLTNKPRGFGFAIFEDFDPVDKCCVKKFIRIKDRDVEVKKALSQIDIRRGDSPSRGRGGGRFSRGGEDYGRDPYDSYSRHRDYPPVGAASGDYARYPPSDYPRYQSSDYPRYPPSDYPRYQSSDYPRYPPSDYPRYQSSDYPRYPPSDYPRYQSSDYPRYPPSDYPRYQSSDYPRYPPSDYPRYQSSDYPRYPPSDTPRYQSSDYPRYPATDSYTGGGYGGGGYSDRSAAGGYNSYPAGYRGDYNSSTYGGGMHGGSTAAGDYQQQTASNFGPSRWYGDSGGREREHGGGRSAQFHPYRH